MKRNVMRQTLTDVYLDTIRFIYENMLLKAAVGESRKYTVVYPADVQLMPKLSESADKAGSVEVTRHRTFEAILDSGDKYKGMKTAVLNFASATRPGGGVRSGAGAQEECLCRCSTLLPAIDKVAADEVGCSSALDTERDVTWDSFYQMHRDRHDLVHAYKVGMPRLGQWSESGPASGIDTLYTDTCIYTPGVVICKTDTLVPERLDAENWRTTDVITCAAPNLRRRLHDGNINPASEISEEDLLTLHEMRLTRILQVALSNGVDALILGAFGCGAFMNDPRIVAEAHRRVLTKFRHNFEKIEYAVYCRDGETKNFDAFSELLDFRD